MRFEITFLLLKLPLIPQQTPSTLDSECNGNRSDLCRVSKQGKYRKGAEFPPVSDLWADTAVNWGDLEAHSLKKGQCVLAGISWLMVAPSAHGERDVGMNVYWSSCQRKWAFGWSLVPGPGVRSAGFPIRCIWNIKKFLSFGIM